MPRGYTGPRGSVTIPLLHLAKWQEDDLHKRMNCARMVYNAMLGKVLKRMRCMEQTREYKIVATEICRLTKEIYDLKHPEKDTVVENADKQIEEKEKELEGYYSKKNEILKKYHFTEYDFKSEVAKYNCFPENLNSTMAQKSIAEPLWAAFESRYYPKRRNKKGELPMPKFKSRKFRDMMSIQSNGLSGIRLVEKENGYVLILSNQRYTKKKNEILIPFAQLNDYEMEALSRDMALLIVQEIQIKGKRAYTLTVSYKGLPPIKYDKFGNEKHPYNKTGLVGISIYDGVVCAVSQDEVYTASLIPENYDEVEAKKVIANQNMTHLRIVNNRQNYYPDGRIRKAVVLPNGQKRRKKWFRSEHYKQQIYKNSEYFRIERVNKELKQWEICNHILGMGDSFYCVKMNLDTEKELFDETVGKTKDDYGYHKEKEKKKVIAATAPAALICKINNRLKHMEQPEVEMITISSKYYWYQHDLEKWDKEQEKIITVENHKLPQNLYRAYLLLHLSPAEEEQTKEESVKTEEQKEEKCFYDTEKCKEDFDAFYALYQNSKTD